ncbi:unnamed protein product [Rhodiola kirilowii]
MVVTKKRIEENEEFDRISDLPNEVIDCILDRVSIKDAVRTSILARKWRSHWTRLTNLVFDQDFVYDEVMKTEYNDHDKLYSDYIDIVGTFLLLHNGPIHKFVLFIPDLRTKPPFHINFNKWMHVVSHSGVKEISLDTPGNRFRTLSSYLYDCLELRCLTLRNCAIKHRYNFIGFANLISLQLSKVWIFKDGDLSTLVSDCPLLENLFIEWVSWRSFTVSALKLQTMSFRGFCLADFTMRNVPNLVTLSLRSDGRARKPYEIVNFFGVMPKIESITLGQQIFKILAEHHVPSTLPTPLKCLRILTIMNINVAKPKQVLCVLCMLRSSPYLQTLNLGVYMIESLVNQAAEAANVANLDEQSVEPDYNLSSLVTVKINGLQGTRPQTTFAKFILASCTALEKLYVDAVNSIPQETELMMKSELMECNRASTKAKIIYSKGQGRRDMSYLGRDDSFVFDFDF